MTSRARDMGRKYLSGAEKARRKREASEEQQKLLQKMPKLTAFFSTTSPSAVGSTTYDDDTMLELQQPCSSSSTTEQEQQEPTKAIETQQPCYSPTPIIPDLAAQSNDLGEWPLILTYEQKRKWAARGSSECQHMNSDFTKSKRFYGAEGCNRYCKKQYFTHVHKTTNEKRLREWLCYSETKGNLYCFICKLEASSNTELHVFCEGFNDWKNAQLLIERHELSSRHKAAVLYLINLRKDGEKIDAALTKQLEDEKKYWGSLLERIINVIKFLCERGLAFRGTDETVGSPSNGNYLGLLELLATVDPFLCRHIQMHANRGKGHTSYLSKTICEEVVEILGKAAEDTIVSELKEAKYFSISLDSTPDITHTDQLCFTVRYVKPTGPVERFLAFLPMEGHTAQQIFDSLVQYTSEKGINLADCRGQSYDNASNMSGKYNGVQALVKEKFGAAAEYVPCYAHSLNLVGVCAAQACPEVVQFFDFVENIYVFFAASSHRWSILERAGGGVLKRLSATRWSARADAIKVIKECFPFIKEALEKLANDQEQKAECRQQANGLLEKMELLETGILVVVWNSLLERFQATQASLQAKQQDLNIASALCASLAGSLQNFREQFDTFESEAQNLTQVQDYRPTRTRRIARNRRRDEDVGSGRSVPDAIDNQSPKDRFRVEVFLAVMDSLLSALEQRRKAYTQLNTRFSFLRNLHDLTPEQIQESADRLLEAYPHDLEDGLKDELPQFSEFVKHIGVDCSSPELNYFTLIKENNIDTTFPNTDNLLRIYLCMMVTNCTGERSFSKMKLIKNYLRNTMGQERLHYLTLLNVENDVLKSLNSSEIIAEFAEIKMRRKDL